ncbi:MAG TPA: flagellar motor protein MotB [Burkholderiales bacterium]|nr:flagellar motor protein MotB [Burkholderiales bacterium]
MWNDLTRVLFVATLVAGGLAFYFQDDNAAQREKAEEAEARTRQLDVELAQARAEVGQLSQRVQQAVAKVSKEKEEELAKLARTHDEMVESMKQEIAAGEIAVTRIADRLSVKIVDRILFPSGEAAIGESGRRVLARVGQVLAGAKDKTIRIEGHTDNVPIGKPLQTRYASNWELSAERATTVARFLQEATSIEPAAFEAVGLGEYHPLADNRNVKGRSQNRRIEIVLYPRVRTIAKELPKGTATVRR